jgi:hypothetical protein
MAAKKTASTAGGYVFPFLHYSWGRVDQGVDFTGSGAIVAIGNARILRTGAPGWPNGGAGPVGQGVLYKLLDGPQAGQIVYVYEGLTPTVKAGQTVQAGQQIAKFYPGSSIEMGLADSAGVPLSHSTYTEGKVTTWGTHMKSFLAAIEHNKPTGNAGVPLGQVSLNPQSAGDIVLGQGFDLAGQIAQAVIQFFIDALSADGARILLYLVLVLGGGVLIYTGAARGLGVGGHAQEAAA